MIIRVRTQLGTWRLKDVQADETVGDLRSRLESEHHTDLQGRPLTKDPAGNDPLADLTTVKSAQLKNGDMVYAMIDDQKVHEQAKTKREITKDGNIVALKYSAGAAKSGFRPGMLPLRDMKMQWTLNDFIALDEQFVYKMKRQEAAVCKNVTLDNGAVASFSKYMSNYDFRKMRIGYLYGHFLADNKVQVECIYEPPQESTDTTFHLLDDPLHSHVETLSSYLDLKRVGWIIGHPPREKGFFFSGHEVMTAAELQLESAGGMADTSFVTVKMTVDSEGSIVVEGYQVSHQCMEMVAEGVLELSVHLGMCKVNPTFTAIQEGKPTDEVDNSFFLNNVPISRHESVTFVATFPPLNRVETPSQEDLKRQLIKAGTNGWTMQDLLADFNLLLFISDYLDMERDMPSICNSLLDRETPIFEGHQLLLRMIAGIDD